MSGTLHSRLVIRDPADTFDALVLSSHPDDDNPFLTAPPSGDGESLDPLTGKVAFAEYVFRAADASGTITTDSEGTTATARVITGILADSAGQWAGVNRRASWYESTDDGANWTLIYAGWLIQVTLTGGIEWALHIGDSDRTERQAIALTSIPTGTGWSGTNIVGAPPSFGPVQGYPEPWRFRVLSTGDSDSDLPSDAVLLKFRTGWALSTPDTPLDVGDPNTNDDIHLRLDDLEAEDVFRLNEQARPFAVRNSARQWLFGTADSPGLTATVTTTAGASVGSFIPYGFTMPFVFDYAEAVGGGSELLALNTVMALKWSGTLPSDDTEYLITVAPSSVSKDSPAHFSGHPVDFVTTLFTEAGITYDSTSAATVKAALGDLSVQYRFTETKPLWSLCESAAFGPFGFAVRRNTAWEWEFFQTRTIPASEPSETIDESAMYDPERPIFDLGQGPVVTAVVWKTQVFKAWTSDLNVDRPPDGIVSVDKTQTFTLDGTADEAEQLVYELPGFVFPYPLSNDNSAYVLAESLRIIERWGRGVPSSEIATLRASGIAAKLGEFVVVDLDHKPTIDTGSTPPGVRGGARICQVVHRTRDPAGPVLSLLDVGTATSNALVPTFTLAQKTGDTRHTAQLTLTNSGDLTGYMVEVQVNTGASEPTGGTSLPLFAPDAVAHDLPAQLAGSTVWARARVVKSDELPGAWSDWASVALDAVPPVTGLSNAAGANDTERVLTWTVGDASLPVRVRWKATADASYLHSITLPAGSTTYTITGIVPGTAMTAAVDHVENSPFTGDSTDATTTWTAGSTTPTLTAPTNPQGFTDGNGTYGLKVTASVLPSRVSFMQAVEDSVGAGTYGTPVEVGNIASVAGASACVVTLTRANDGLRVQLTAHHEKTGYSDSADTTAVTLDPWETDATVPVDASDAALVTVGAVPASLPNGRQLAGESGVVEVTDAGAGSTVTVGLVAGGVPLGKLAAGSATDGQVATYDSTNGWQPEDSSAVGVAQATDLVMLWNGGLSESIELVDVTTGKLRLEYSVDNGSTFVPLDDTDDTPVVSLEVAGAVRGDWATPDSGFTGATNDVLLRVVALDADGTATELNERLRIWKNPGGIQSARIGCDVLVAGAFGVDPVIGSVFLEFNAAGTTVTPPPDPEPGDGVTDAGPPEDTYPVARGLLRWGICDKGTFHNIAGSQDGVDRITDLSGNGNHLGTTASESGATVTRGTDTDGAAITNLNGRQPVSFKDAYLQYVDDFLTGLTEGELFIVMKGNDGDPNGNGRDGSWSFGGSGEGSRWSYNTGGGAGTGGIKEDFGSTVVHDLGDPGVDLAAWHVYNVRAAAGQFVVAIDGVVVLTTSTNTVDWSATPRMGMRSTGSKFWYAEDAIHSAILTTDERALVLAALQSRWGL